MPGGRTECAERSEEHLEKENLKRSRTEKHMQSPHEDPTVKLFSDKVPDKEKVCFFSFTLFVNVSLSLHLGDVRLLLCCGSVIFCQSCKATIPFNDDLIVFLLT